MRSFGLSGPSGPIRRYFAGLRDDPALRQGGALFVAAFVYRLCSVGFSLLPALAVLRGLEAGEASVLLGSVRAAGFVGGLLGGVLADRYGIRLPMLVGLAGAAVGIGLAGAPLPLTVLFVSAPFAALGHACFQPMVRLAIGVLVEPAHQKLAVAWMRTGNNLASLFGFALVAVAADIGLFPLYLLDAATTALALLVTWRRVPPVRALRAPATAGTPGTAGTSTAEAAAPDTRLPFLLFSFIMMANMVVYELYTVSEAAALALAHPERGVAWFGGLMVLNTAVCVIFAVPASRWIRNPAVAVPVGLALQGLGLAVAAVDFADLRLAVLSMALVTLGEIMITALSGYVLLRLAPRGAHMAKAYAGQAVLLDFGRLLGAGLAFPLIVEGRAPVLVGVCLGVITCLGAWVARPVWHAYAHLER